MEVRPFWVQLINNTLWIYVGFDSSYYARGDFCRLQITFAKSLAPDQDRQNVGPDLDPNRLTSFDSVPERNLDK